MGFWKLKMAAWKIAGGVIPQTRRTKRPFLSTQTACQLSVEFPTGIATTFRILTKKLALQH